MKMLDKQTAKANFEICRDALKKVGISRHMQILEGLDDYQGDDDVGSCSNVKFFLIKTVTSAHNLASSRVSESIGDSKYDINVDLKTLSDSIQKARKYVELAHPELRNSAQSLLELCEAAATVAMSDSTESPEYLNAVEKIEAGRGRKNWDRLK